MPRWVLVNNDHRTATDFHLPKRFPINMFILHIRLLGYGPIITVLVEEVLAWKSYLWYMAKEDS